MDQQYTEATGEPATRDRLSEMTAEQRQAHFDRQESFLEKSVTEDTEAVVMITYTADKAYAMTFMDEAFQKERLILHLTGRTIRGLLNVKLVNDAPTNNRLSLSVGPLLFCFTSFSSWCDNAARLFRVNQVTHSDVLCVDTRGRVCTSGKDFMRAERENAYPINIYRIEPDDSEEETPAASSAVGNDAPLAESASNPE